MPDRPSPGLRPGAELDTHRITKGAFVNQQKVAAAGQAISALGAIIVCLFVLFVLGFIVYAIAS